MADGYTAGLRLSRRQCLTAGSTTKDFRSGCLVYRFIGDSHSHSLFCRVRPGRCYWLGPKTMYGFSGDWREALVSVRRHVRKADRLVFCFGEIDVRCHVLRLATEQSTRWEIIVDDLARRYAQALADLRDNLGNDIAVACVMPPGDVSNSADVPVIGELSERVAATERLNAALSGFCVQMGAPFIDYYADCADADGALRLELSDDGFHLNPKHDELVLSAMQRAGLDARIDRPYDPTLHHIDRSKPPVPLHTALRHRLHRLKRTLLREVGR